MIGSKNMQLCIFVPFAYGFMLLKLWNRNINVIENKHAKNYSSLSCISPSQSANSQFDYD